MLTQKILITTALLTSTAFASNADIILNPITKNRDVKITIDFTTNRFAVSGGCNIIAGIATISDDHIFQMSTGNNAISTKMACVGDLEKVDQRITDFLTSKPKLINSQSKLFLVTTLKGEKGSTYIPVTIEKGSYNGITAPKYKTKFIYVSHQTVPCPKETTKQCFQIREDKNKPWKAYEGTIEGFKHEPNIDYRLRLKEYGKGKSKQWALDLVVEQSIVKS